MQMIKCNEKQQRMRSKAEKRMKDAHKGPSEKREEKYKKEQKLELETGWLSIN